MIYLFRLLVYWNGIVDYSNFVWKNVDHCLELEANL